MENVSVVSNATPMVAVRPGSAPMTMPRKVAQITLKSDVRASRTRERRRRTVRGCRTWSSRSSGQPDREDLLEHQRHENAGSKPDAATASPIRRARTGHGWRDCHSNRMVNMATKIAEASQNGTRPISPTTKTRPRRAAPARRRSLFPWACCRRAPCRAPAMRPGGRQRHGKPDAEQEDDDAVKARHQPGRGVDLALLVRVSRHQEGQPRHGRAEHEEDGSDRRGPCAAAPAVHAGAGLCVSAIDCHHPVADHDESGRDRPGRLVRVAVTPLRAAESPAYRERPWPCRRRSRARPCSAPS